MRLRPRHTLQEQRGEWQQRIQAVLARAALVVSLAGPPAAPIGACAMATIAAADAARAESFMRSLLSR